MNRRDFFKVASVLALGNSFNIRTVAAMRNATPTRACKWNPAYENANYEMRIGVLKRTSMCQQDICKRFMSEYDKTILPLRFNIPVNLYDPEEVKRESIPPFIYT